jgi:hypothetical protein
VTAGTNPTTLAGYGITDALSGSGTVGYLTIWTGAKTQGNAPVISDGANVAIGKSTIEAWNPNFRALQIGGNAAIISFAAEGSGNSSFYMNNCYYDTAGFKPMVSGSASMFGNYGNVFHWFIHSGLTADVAFVPTAFASLDESTFKLGQNLTGALAAPYSLDLGTSFSNSTTYDKLKIKVHSGGYGFTVGSGAGGDLQYHVPGSGGLHEFYINNTNRFSVKSNGPNIPAGSYLNATVTAGFIGSQNIEPPIQIVQSIANTDALMLFNVAGDYLVNFGLDGTTNDLFVGGWSMGAVKHKIWHAGNDGTGSTLDADLLDGLHASSFAQISGLTTNYHPKWNGSTLVNSLVSDDGNNVYMNLTGGDGITFHGSNGFINEIASKATDNSILSLQTNGGGIDIYGSGVSDRINIDGQTYFQDSIRTDRSVNAQYGTVTGKLLLGELLEFGTMENTISYFNNGYYSNVDIDASQYSCIAVSCIPISGNSFTFSNANVGRVIFVHAQFTSVGNCKLVLYSGNLTNYVELLPGETAMMYCMRRTTTPDRCYWQIWKSSGIQPNL